MSQNVQFIVTKNQKIKNIIVHSDRQRLQQILFNLLLNAFKFTKKGYVEFKVEVYNLSSSIDLSIIDTGIGIERKKQKSIFNILQDDF